MSELFIFGSIGIDDSYFRVKKNLYATAILVINLYLIFTLAFLYLLIRVNFEYFCKVVYITFHRS